MIIKSYLNKMKKQDKKKPFFANFLENQIKETEQVKGGKSSNSITYPWRDNVTSPYKDGHQTMKYPSDGDEGVDS